MDEVNLRDSCAKKGEIYPAMVNLPYTSSDPSKEERDVVGNRGGPNTH